MFSFPISAQHHLKIESGGTEISFDLIEYGGKDGAMISEIDALQVKERFRNLSQKTLNDLVR